MKTTILVSLLFIFSFSFINAQNIKEINLLLVNNKYEEAVTLGETLCIENPQDADVFFKTAVAFKNMNKYPEAERYFENAFKLDTSAIKYANAYANILAINEEYRKAIIIYKSILRENNDHSNSLRNLAGIYIKTKKFNRAKELFDKLVKIDPDNSYYYRMIGNCYLQTNFKEKAIAEYEKAYKTDSTSTKNIKHLASVYFNKKDFEKCLNICEKGKIIDSLYSDFYRLSGKANFHLLSYELSKLNFLKVIELNDSTKQISSYLGKTLYKLEDYKSALTYIKAAYKEDSTNLQLCRYMGKIYFELNDHTKAIYYYNRTLDLLEIPPATLYSLYLDLSILYYEKAMYKEALNTFKKKLKLTSKVSNIAGKSAQDYYFLASIYDKTNKYKQAINNYTEYTKIIESYNKDVSKDDRYKYAKQRIIRIKEELHFQGKTLPSE